MNAPPQNGKRTQETGNRSVMSNAEKHAIVTVETVLASMTPGESHTVREIARRVKRGVPSVQTLLTECVARRTVRKAHAGKRHVYWLLTAEEADRLGRADLPTWSEAVLEGYDAANRRFQEACMASRRPLSDSPDDNTGSRPDD
ncbi:putative transcriptional regulator [Paraburkholderia sp. GAS448]